ncbi:MAG: tsaB [Rickettsiales bacterium]|nr:tsaB [Rickettsiales bacterium]
MELKASGNVYAVVVVEESIEHEHSKQAERLIPMIEASLQQKNIGYADLFALAVSVGPGSFAGVRIGLAAMRGFTLVYPKLPLVGVSTLEALAVGHSDATQENILTIIDARRGQVYAQHFEVVQGVPNPKTEPALLDYNKAAELAKPGYNVVGNGAVLIAPFCVEGVQIIQEKGLPTAADIAEAARRRGFIHDGSSVAPLYIRLPDAKEQIMRAEPV